MAFFMGDDQLTVNAKMRRLTEGSLLGDLRGLAAQALWLQAGTLCQASLTDGLVSRPDVIRLLLNPPLADELAGLLVDAGLWHGPGHTCEHQDCTPVPAGHWRFHQWWQFGYDSAEKVKASRAKRAELKDRDLRDAVWLRDAIDPANPNRGRCRYCGTEVQRYDRTSARAPHLDHVDPSLAKGATNLAVCCGECSQRKGQRTPAQAGMTLRPAPRPLALPDAAVSPPQSAAETPQAAPAASPPSGAAEAPQGRVYVEWQAEPGAEGVWVPGRPQAPAEAPSSQLEPRASHEPAPSAVHGRTRTGTRTGAGQARAGAGQGQGEGEGPGKPSSRRSRRRRGRGSRRPTRAPEPPTDPEPVPTSQTWDAGTAPRVTSAGRWGSPWADWSGRPGDDAPETRCQHHPGEHQPCRRCRQEDRDR